LWHQDKSCIQDKVAWAAGRRAAGSVFCSPFIKFTMTRNIAAFTRTHTRAAFTLTRDFAPIYQDWQKTRQPGRGRPLINRLPLALSPNATFVLRKTSLIYRLAMKTSLKFLLYLSLSICLSSCHKKDDKTDVDSLNFYDDEYRIGEWIAPGIQDTLEFLDNSHMIRKGRFYVYEEYIYKIDSNRLYVAITDYSQGSQHSIIKAEEDIVTLGNMYISTGFWDNSGTFQKIVKK
jgi:hypothetical protein